MPRYLLFLQYDAQGAKSLLQETAMAREAAARKAIESISGKIESIYFTASGEYQVAIIAEYPNAATAATLAAMILSTGAVSKFNLIELITASEIDRAYVVLTNPVETAS